MKTYKICIDAGHGGKDSGAVNGKRYEKDDTLKLAKRLGKVLKANGLEVDYTRTTDVYDGPSIKAKKGNTSKADYFISFHRNAATPSATGTEVLIYSLSGKKADIAKDICKRFKKRGFVDRGVKVRTDLAVLRGTSMPAMLIELGFISNSKDNKLFDDNFYGLVNDVARAVMGQLGLKFRTLTELGN